MRRRRARLIAASIVATAIAGSAAHGDFAITPAAPTSATGMFDHPLRVVVSLRNATGAPIRITGVHKQVPIAPQCLPSIGIAPLSGGFPIDLAPGAQVQLVASAPAGFTTTEILQVGSPSCTWVVDDVPPGTTDVFTTSFGVTTMAFDAVDPQPHAMSFGSQAIPASETQTIQLVNLRAGPATVEYYVITGDPTGSVVFAGGPCSGLQACETDIPLAEGQFAEIEVRCAATSVASFVGSVDFYTGASEVVRTTYECHGVAGAPGIEVTPASITAAPLAVGAASEPDYPIAVRNTGTAPIDIGIDFEPVHGAHWRASACTTAAPCTLAGGQTRMIDVEFRPQRHGDLASVLTVHSAVGTRTVTLAGSATGGTLSVLEPTGGEIDFGVIPLDAPRTRTVRLANPGNAAITATAAVTGGPGSPGSPFAVAPGALVLPPNGGAGELEVTCRSPVAGSFTGSVALASDGYAGDTAIAVRCTVADTRLEVAPSELDFGEVRIGSDAPSIEVVLRNPGPLPLALASVALEGAPDALTATSVPPQTLEVGATAALTLALATGEDVALEAGPSQLVIHVDGEQLRLPVRGRVVTPAARIAPDRLDLGTLCIGSPVTGALALRNVGTATLQAAAPVVDPAQAFALRLIDPTSYPAILAPDTSAAIEIAPSSTTPGHVEGLVSWDVDVPSAPLAVPVAVEFIADGTAVSPREVRAESDVGMTTPWRTVTLQNCSSSPVAVTLAGVVAVVRGANAWDVTPRAEQRTLGPRETMAVQVRFAPKRPGAHQAYLDLSVGGAPLPVDLIGHAFGVEPERTSFYACACSTSANPIGGAPIAAALVIAMRRRRRSPAMPRSGMLGR